MLIYRGHIVWTIKTNAHARCCLTVFAFNSPPKCGELKGGGHGKFYSEFIVYIFSLGSLKTHDTIFKFLEFVKVVKQADKISQNSHLMVSSISLIMSQVEHTKKRNSIDGESRSVKRNADHQNRLTVCFYMLLYSTTIR